MSIVPACLILVLGLAIIWKSADLLVAGAVSIAEHFGISQFIIAMTVVAIGTSAPEAATGITAAIRGAGDIAIGNVYGSNIANIALVGGLCAIIAPITAAKRMLKLEIPFMLFGALLLWPVLHNLNLSRLEAAGLLAVFATMMFLIVRFAEKNKPQTNQQQKNSKTSNVIKSLLFVTLGLAGLAVGAKVTIDAAVFIGEYVGLSETVIGLTIIAVGTSLPELATCVVASFKGHNDITIGNIVGSNIFNALLVVGSAGIIRPLTIGQRLAGTDCWIMIAATAVFAFLVLIRGRIGRASGILLLLGYAGFLIYLFGYSS
ncbi:MAG: calcium/sodium antiporter [Planctomycetes bacterium]|nr:calcium/sodium antiporter [Planctomycetota bacterium]